MPQPGADEECDEAQAAIDEIEERLQDLLKKAKARTGWDICTTMLTVSCKEIKFWHSAQGNKEIYQLEVPAKITVPSNWTKCGGTKVSRAELLKLIPGQQSLLHS